MTSGSSGQRGELNLAAKVVEATHEALDRLGAVAVREVVGAEILVWDAVFEHVVSGGKQGGGDREDSFLSAAAGLLTVPHQGSYTTPGDASCQRAASIKLT